MVSLFDRLFTSWNCWSVTNSKNRINFANQVHEVGGSRPRAWPMKFALVPIASSGQMDCTASSVFKWVDSQEHVESPEFVGLPKICQQLALAEGGVFLRSVKVWYRLYHTATVCIAHLEVSGKRFLVSFLVAQVRSQCETLKYSKRKRNLSEKSCGACGRTANEVPAIKGHYRDVA